MKPKSKTILDLAHLKKVLNSKETFVYEMLEVILKMLPDISKRFQEGLASRDQDEIGQAAHKMKSTILLLGNKEMTGLVRSIDTLCQRKGNVNWDTIEQHINEFNTKTEVVVHEIKEILRNK